ncbi:hypothetical protein CEXT_570721 [Caerostris extrusa]|uniref:Uncharacterized protein n=1 Tax=Caerostris extrusa TaxID=172846 RepID=A0AAV4Y2A7_CAEEX|nr:hypothetical protein CEXT_570721 [Caerostris extrusa]
MRNGTGPRAYGLKAPALIEPSSGRSESLIFGLRTLHPPSVHRVIFEIGNVRKAYHCACIQLDRRWIIVSTN